MSNLLAFVPAIVILLLVVGGISIFSKKGNRAKVAKRVVLTVVLAVLASIVARLIAGQEAQVIVLWVVILGAILWFAVFKKRFPMKEGIPTRIPSIGNRYSFGDYKNCSHDGIFPCISRIWEGKH